MLTLLLSIFSVYPVQFHPESDPIQHLYVAHIKDVVSGVLGQDARREPF